MKYRMLFLIKLSYYLNGKRVTINTEMYSLLYSFINNFIFTDDQELMIDQIMCRENEICEINYKKFNDAYESIQQMCSNKDCTYLDIPKYFYLKFTKNELSSMDNFVCFFYNFYSKYVEVLTNGKEHVGPYDSKIYTRTYYIS